MGRRRVRGHRLALLASTLTLSATSALLVALLVVSPAQAAGTTDMISRNSQGVPGSCQSGDGATSADGRLVVFESCAGNLAPGDGGPWGDVFLRNRTAGTTTRLSVASNGVQGNGNSSNPAISSDGRYVVFASGASNLATPDSNGLSDVVRLDRQTGAFDIVSKSRTGAGSNGNSGEDTSAVSDNGRYVAFVSRATNLTTNADTNTLTDVYLRDMTTGKTVLVSKTMTGEAGGSNEAVEISGNGRYVVFESSSPTLVPDDNNGPDAFVYDRVSKSLVSVSQNKVNGLDQHAGEAPSISTTGAVVAFEGMDAGGSINTGDVWAVTLQLSNGVPQVPNPADYRLVSTSSSGAEANGTSHQPAVSGNGKKVAFWSSAETLVGGDTNDKDDVFVRTLGTSKTIRVSVRSVGGQANDASPAFGGPVDINASGNTTVWTSFATNLVPNDNNNSVDVFAHIQ